VKCYIDNFVHLRSCIRNINIHLSVATVDLKLLYFFACEIVVSLLHEICEQCHGKPRIDMVNKGNQEGGSSCDYGVIQLLST
jgi:hypothetical protein